jgi:hypothetical protein
VPELIRYARCADPSLHTRHPLLAKRIEQMVQTAQPTPRTRRVKHIKRRTTRHTPLSLYGQKVATTIAAAFDDGYR